MRAGIFYTPCINSTTNEVYREVIPLSNKVKAFPYATLRIDYSLRNAAMEELVHYIASSRRLVGSEFLECYDDYHVLIGSTPWKPVVDKNLPPICQFEDFLDGFVYKYGLNYEGIYTEEYGNTVFSEQ